jgi:hypothetical protein
MKEFTLKTIYLYLVLHLNTYLTPSFCFSADGVENSVTSVSYDLDKQYSNSRNGTTELTTVTKPQENMLVYNSKVPSNGWWMENSTVFSQDGIVATLRNLNSNFSCTKYYKKMRAPLNSTS